MLPFSYEDRYPDPKYVAGYGATNEEPQVARELLKGKRIHNGLGIASGGEITFFAVLPRVTNSLTLVDHSYRSLRAFCLKALLLTTIGPKETRKLFLSDKKNWEAAIAKVEGHLPYTMSNKVADLYGDILQYSAFDLRKEWFYGDMKELAKAVQKLHKIRLIHGDLLDTEDRGPFDFLYLSNAMQHKCKRIPGHSYPSSVKLTGMLQKKAQVLWTAGVTDRPYGEDSTALNLWTNHRHIDGYRSLWRYRLSQVKD